LVIDEDFEGIAHELAADILHILRHGCREHHHLLLGRSSLKDRLHVSSHIYNKLVELSSLILNAA
jgi:hypothetical protein